MLLPTRHKEQNYRVCLKGTAKAFFSSHAISFTVVLLRQWHLFLLLKKCFEPFFKHLFCFKPVVAPMGSLTRSDSTIPERTQLCSNHKLASLDKGRACGAPLGAPCFNQSLCREGNGGKRTPKIYVYDNEVSPHMHALTSPLPGNRMHVSSSTHVEEYMTVQCIRLGLEFHPLNSTPLLCHNAHPCVDLGLVNTCYA